MFDEVMIIFVGLVGFGLLISILVNIGKAVGIVKDGTAGTWEKCLNFLGFAAVFYLTVFKVPVDWNSFDEYLKMAAMFAGLLLQLMSSGKTYDILKGFPILGYSHSKKLE